jgi:CBS domain-containing protein
MTIAAILHHKGNDIVSVGPHASIAEVCLTLAEHRIGAVPVTDDTDQRHILGMLSERDIVRVIATHGAAALAMTVDQVMTHQIRTASPRVTVNEAMAMMTEGRFRHLPILDGERLVGLVSIGDVVKARIETVEQEAESLKAYVAGSV